MGTSRGQGEHGVMFYLCISHCLLNYIGKTARHHCVCGFVSSMTVYDCVQVGVLQYGEVAVHEWSLRDYQTTKEVVEAAKNISRQEGRETRTAYAIHMGWYVCQSFISHSLWLVNVSIITHSAL